MPDHLSKPGLDAAYATVPRELSDTAQEAIQAAITAYLSALPDDEETVDRIAKAMAEDKYGVWEYGHERDAWRLAARAALRALGESKEGTQEGK